MKIGLLGAGRIGRIHGLNVAARGDAELVAVTDAMPEAAASLAAATGANATSTEAILADPAIDAVLICTPTDTHADLIEQAVSAGKAVFCEKPVDLDAARIRRCLATVEKSGKPLMIGFNRRFDPNFAALEKRLRAGEAGHADGAGGSPLQQRAAAQAGKRDSVHGHGPFGRWRSGG